MDEVWFSASESSAGDVRKRSTDGSGRSSSRRSSDQKRSGSNHVQQDFPYPQQSRQWIHQTHSKKDAAQDFKELSNDSEEEFEKCERQQSKPSQLQQHHKNQLNSSSMKKEQDKLVDNNNENYCIKSDRQECMENVPNTKEEERGYSKQSMSRKSGKSEKKSGKSVGHGSQRVSPSSSVHDRMMPNGEAGAGGVREKPCKRSPTTSHQ